MEQLKIFLELIRENWVLSTIIILSIIIVVANILNGASLALKIVFSLLIVGMAGVIAFVLITFLS